MVVTEKEADRLWCPVEGIAADRCLGSNCMWWAWLDCRCDRDDEEKRKGFCAACGSIYGPAIR